MVALIGAATMILVAISAAPPPHLATDSTSSPAILGATGPTFGIAYPC